MKELSIEQKVKACDSNYKVYTELINRLENVKEAIKKQNYGIAMDVLCKPYPEFQVTTHSELKGSEDEDIKHFLVDFIKVCRWTEKKDQGWPSREKCIAWLEKQSNLMKALQISNARIGELIEKNYYLKEQLEKQGKNNMGISKATKHELEDNLNKALEKETPESWNKFLDEQGEQKPFGKRDECLHCQFNYAGECKGFCAMKRSNRKPHKPADTPKFKVGDWVVSPNGVYWHIDAIQDERYQVSSDSGKSADWPLDTNIYHSFSIQDAKDGDVLADEYGIYIFNSFDSLDDKLFICKCAYQYSKKVFEFGGMLCKKTDVYPATKEQRDTLMKAMADAGYKWDAENRQLKKVESRQEELTEFEKAVKQVMEEAIECGDTHNLKADAYMLLRLVQKPAWSKEDEKMLSNINDCIRNLPVFYESININGENKITEQFICAAINWLKSLKDRYAWKPSDEQMDALNDVISSRDIKYDVLSELWKDLKKLKG